MLTFKNKLVSAATRYDERQKNRKPRKPGLGNGYNPYALPQYLQRIDDILADVSRGASPREAIVAGTTPSPLRTALLKAAGFPPDYSDNGAWGYAPVTADE